MIRSRIQVVNNFAKVTERVNKMALEAVAEAAAVAAPVAQANATIDLELEVIPAHGDIEGFSSGIKSRKQTRTPGRSTPIAPFFDGGTLGKRRRKLKQPGRREESWQVKRGGSSYTAHRHGITAEMGIAPQGFFGKARKAGRAAMVARISRGA